jgi:outer membrane protein assembly factor BamB
VQKVPGGYFMAGDEEIISGAFIMKLWKLDENGKKIFEKPLGDFSSGFAHSMEIANDENILLVGSKVLTGKKAGIITVHKIDQNGNKIWEKPYGAKSESTAQSIRRTSDGGFIIAGNTTPIFLSNYDILVIKLDEHGY